MDIIITNTDETNPLQLYFQKLSIITYTLLWNKWKGCYLTSILTFEEIMIYAFNKILFIKIFFNNLNSVIVLVRFQDESKVQMAQCP